MVKLGSIQQHSSEGQSLVVSLSSLGLMLCMVVVVLGIKFRWFKQRLNFEPLPGSSGSADNGQVVLRSSRSSQEQFREPVVAQGVFRKKLDEDVIIERPKTLPPVRIRKSSKGPPSFGPPKRSVTPSTTVEEPVVIPPPPPPLPTASSLSSLRGSNSSTPSPIFAKSRVRTAPTETNGVQIANGGVNKTYEQLKTEEEQNSTKYAERRPTGYVRPSDEINEQLLNNERQPPEAQPRNLNPDKPKELFKKNPQKTRTTIEPLKGEEEENESWKMGQRRLTGFFPPSDEDRENMEDMFERDTIMKPPNKVVFHLDDEDDDDNKDADDDEVDNGPKPPPPPPILFSTQISADESQNSPDSWSAIQRHRNLAQEISQQHEAMQNRRRENERASGPVPGFRNPLAAQEQPQQEPKPRTMRDMKRNNARNDLLLDSERNGTDA